MKKVFLPNGEEVELLAEYKDGNKTEYVVKVLVSVYINPYNGDSEFIYENRIVPCVYENYEDVPLYLKKTELERKVEELEKNIKELTEQKTKLIKELKSVYQPQYPIGTPIYYTRYGSDVEELKIVRIVFTEEENDYFYTYYCDKEYRSFKEIGDGYYLTKEEAEKARQDFLEKEKLKERERIIKEYQEAKRKFEMLKRSED